MTDKLVLGTDSELNTLSRDIDKLGETALRIATERNNYKKDLEHVLAQWDALKADRDRLLAAATAAHEWICSVTNWEENVPYVNGRYDVNVNLLDAQLRTALERKR